MSDAHEQLQELQEHAEHARHEADLAPVSLTMAVLAVLVACVTLLGHRAHTEEILLQNRATDQWNYFQAKNIRRDGYQLLLDLSKILPGKDKGGAEQLRSEYRSKLEHETELQKKIKSEADKLEAEVEMQEHRAGHFDVAEGLLEAALVITSITLLTRRRGFWFVGAFVAVGGIIVAALAFRIH
jgi:hypothetical protein